MYEWSHHGLSVFYYGSIETRNFPLSKDCHTGMDLVIPLKAGHTKSADFDSSDSCVRQVLQKTGLLCCLHLLSCQVTSIVDSSWMDDPPTSKWLAGPISSERREEEESSSSNVKT